MSKIVATVTIRVERPGGEFLEVTTIEGDPTA